jgi:hypothetical protein
MLVLTAGYTDAVKGLIRLGLLSPDPHPFLHELVRLQRTAKGNSNPVGSLSGQV